MFPFFAATNNTRPVTHKITRWHKGVGWSLLIGWWEYAVYSAGQQLWNQNLADCGATGHCITTGFVIGLLEFHFAMAHDHALC